VQLPPHASASASGRMHSPSLVSGRAEYPPFSWRGAGHSTFRCGRTETFPFAHAGAGNSSFPGSGAHHPMLAGRGANGRATRRWPGRSDAAGWRARHTAASRGWANYSCSGRHLFAGAVKNSRFTARNTCRDKTLLVPYTDPGKCLPVKSRPRIDPKDTVLSHVIEMI
jgi:hypothetical protein